MLFMAVAPQSASPDEKDGAMTQADLLLRMMDKDHDGKLTVEEITNYMNTNMNISDAEPAEVEELQKQQKRLQTHFPEADANNDGFLMKEEITRLDELMTKKEEV